MCIWRKELLALQRKCDHLRSTVEERGERLERKDEDHKDVAFESKRLKATVEELKERLADREKDN